MKIPHALEWTDTHRDWLVDRPLLIAGYILLALVLRYGLHRFVDGLTAPIEGRKPPRLLRILRDRTPPTLRGPLLTDRRAERARTIGSVLKSTISIVLLVWVLLTSLGILGVDVRPFLASAGIVGVAIGFGAQNLVRDFLSGIFMLLEDQYGVGDAVDLGEASGTVESVGLRVTTVRDVDGTLWYVRNGEVLRVGNMSQGHSVARVDLPIAHGNDLEAAQAIALDAATEAVAALVDDVLAPTQLVGVTAVSPDMVTIRLTTRVRPGRQWTVQRAQQQAVLTAFEAAGVRPPYPPARPYGPQPARP